jgi:hypothetical protein
MSTRNKSPKWWHFWRGEDQHRAVGERAMSDYLEQSDAHNVEVIEARVAWYRPEQWSRLLAVRVDSNELPPTHAEWAQIAEATLIGMKRPGVDIVKIDVDVDALVDWCRANGRAVDSAACLDYAMSGPVRRLD